MRVPAGVTDERFADAVRDLLEQRGLTQKQLAGLVGVDPAYLCRSLGSGRDVPASLAARVAEALGLPGHYFPECRESRVIAAVRSDPALRDRLYARLARRP